MNTLFLHLAMSVTGNVVTIIALGVLAALIGYLIAWRYAKSVFIPVIKGLEDDNARLTKQAERIRTELATHSDKAGELEKKISLLAAELENRKTGAQPHTGKSTTLGKYEVLQSKSGEYYFNLKATNGQVILTSPMFHGIDDCKTGIETSRSVCIDDTRFERKISSDNRPYFNLTTQAGKVIGKSEIYESNAGMENGIASVKRNGPTNHVVE